MGTITGSGVRVAASLKAPILKGPGDVGVRLSDVSDVPSGAMTMGLP